MSKKIILNFIFYLLIIILLISFFLLLFYFRPKKNWNFINVYSFLIAIVSLSLMICIFYITLIKQKESEDNITNTIKDYIKERFIVKDKIKDEQTRDDYNLFNKYEFKYEDEEMEYEYEKVANEQEENY